MINPDVAAAAIALKEWAEEHFVKEFTTQYPHVWNPRNDWKLGTIHPVAVTFKGKMHLIGGKTFGGIAWTHWNGNQRYKFSMPEFSANDYYRLRHFVWQQEGFDPDFNCLYDKSPILRDAATYRFTVDGMWNDVKPEYADKHPFGQRWMGLWEWLHPYGEQEWNSIHQVDWGKYKGNPRKYKERLFTVEEVKL